MELSEETETLIPSTVQFNFSYSETGISISPSNTDPNTNQTKVKLIPPHNNQPYYSENDEDWQYKEDHIQNMIASTNSQSYHFKKHKHISRSNSDLTSALRSSRSKYQTKKTKKLSIKLEKLTRDDLKVEYLRERKQRKKEKKQYKEMTRQFHETITKTADEYEDALTQNNTELKQEYEAKLIEAEIKRNKSEQKITALNAEVQKLKSLLSMRGSTPTPSMHSANQSLHSLDAEIGPPIQIYQPINTNMSPLTHNNIHNNHHGYTPITTPIATQMLPPQHHRFSYSGTMMQTRRSDIVERKDNLDEGAVSNQLSMSSHHTDHSRDDEMIGLMPNAKSMQQKLKIAMSPSLKYHHEYVGSFANIGAVQTNEGTDDDDDNMLMFDGYNTYKGNDNNTDSELSDTPPVPSRKKDKKRKKRKKKRKEEEKSFWDFLVKCITPSVCDNTNV